MKNFDKYYEVLEDYFRKKNPQRLIRNYILNFMLNGVNSYLINQEEFDNDYKHEYAVSHNSDIIDFKNYRFWGVYRFYKGY